MNRKKIYIILFLSCFSSLAISQENKLQVRTSVNAGFEYDSNVYKTFKNEKHDFPARFFLTNKGTFSVTDNVFMGWDYQGGGKKFFNERSQDLIIQNISFPTHLKIHNHVQTFFEPKLKYQNERDSLDAAKTDVNEDFLSPSAQLKFIITLPADFNLQPQTNITYFHFYPDKTFSFWREEGGITLEKRLPNLALGVDYTYFKQQFSGSYRTDSIQEISPYFQYLKYPFLSLGYSYQFNHSNDVAYNFHNHKINFLASFLFGKKKKYDDSEQPSARVSLHFIATLQLKKYSSVTGETSDGQRFLVTSSEDENFNNLIVKLNYHISKKWAAETKYTRISNELTNQKTSFSRSIYYAGLRYDF